MAENNSGRQFEEEVADLFRAAGCAAQTRATLPGARGEENVDVVVRLESLGLPDLWIVECKDHASALSRGLVHEFRGKVENVGASRGIMVARSGYQAGCHAVVQNTNIWLTTPVRLHEDLQGRITMERLQRLLARAVSLHEQLVGMERRGTRVEGSPFRRGFTLRLPMGPRSEDYLKRRGWVWFLKEEITELIAGQSTAHFPCDPDEGEDPDDYQPTIRLPSVGEFCSLSEDWLTECESWAAGLVAPQ